MNVYVMKKYLIFFIGLIMFSLGISITVIANFGTSPWDAVCVGLYQSYGLSIGFWINIESMFLIFVGGLLNKEVPKLQCIISSLIIGFFVDVFMGVFAYISVDGVLVQLLVFLLGVLIISMGCGTYLSVNVLPCAIDYFMLSIGKFFKKSISFSMTLCEGCGFLLAFIFQGPIGLGTVLSVFIYGPLIDFFYRKALNAGRTLQEV